MEIKGKTLAEVWGKSIKELIKDDVPWIPTQHGVMAKELCNVIMIVENPLEEPRVSAKYAFPEQFRKGYSKYVFEKYSPTEIIYERLYEYGSNKVNQVKNCLELLQKEWYSRRAVIVLWRPEEDIFSPYPPCICFLQIMIRTNAVELSVVLRSNDAWLSALPDMIALSNFQKKVAQHIGLKCGRYVHHAISYHIYEYDYPKAKEVFSE